MTFTMFVLIVKMLEAIRAAILKREETSDMLSNEIFDEIGKGIKN